MGQRKEELLKQVKGLLATSVCDRKEVVIGGKKFVLEWPAGMPAITVNGRLLWSGMGIGPNREDLKDLVMSHI